MTNRSSAEISRMRVLRDRIEKLAREQNWEAWIQPYPARAGWEVRTRDGRVLVYWNFHIALGVLKLRAAGRRLPANSFQLLDKPPQTC